jgi:leucyl aminopeptidase (aminopeptidase T)
MLITMQMARTARMMLENVVALKKGEDVLILTDTERPGSITEVLAVMAHALEAETAVMTMIPREMGGVEPPPAVAAAMAASQVIINQTSHSLTHTNAQRNAVRAGARVCNIREFDEQMMLQGGITADYRAVKALTEKLAALLTRAGYVRITTPEGTDISFSIEGRKGYVLAGFATEPGQFSGLPDGEAAVAPVEGSGNGIIVNPYMVEKVGPVKEPFKIRVEEGEAAEVTGGTEAQKLKEILMSREPEARNLPAEFAFGTNPKCLLIPKSREIKKKLGTCHVAVGDNLSLGGVVDASLHLDIILLNPTVLVDDRAVLVEGELEI